MVTRRSYFDAWWLREKSVDKPRKELSVQSSNFALKNDPRRPLMFICHSLGGIVVKSVCLQIGPVPIQLTYRYLQCPHIGSGRSYISPFLQVYCEVNTSIGLLCHSSSGWELQQRWRSCGHNGEGRFTNAQ